MIDYIENFILFQNESVKIIAKNHQYLGVNNLMESMENRKELNTQIPAYEQICGVKIMDKEFEKTPKRSIKRFLYKDAEV